MDINVTRAGDVGVFNHFNSEAERVLSGGWGDAGHNTCEAKKGRDQEKCDEEAVGTYTTLVLNFG